MGNPPLLLSRSKLDAIPGIEAVGGLEPARLLHLARRRHPLLVLLGHDEDDLAAALGRLDHPPAVLRESSPCPERIRDAIEEQARVREARRRLASFLARQLSPDPEPLAERLLALASSDEATLLVQGSDVDHRRATSRAIHDLAPLRPGLRRPWVTLDLSRHDELEILHAFLLGTPPFEAEIVHVEGLDAADTATLATLADHLRDRSLESGPRWTFGRDAAGPELPPELEVRRLDLAGPSERSRPSNDEEPRRLEDLEREHVLRVLDECGSNKSRAAAHLGIHRSTLHAKLRSWNLTPRSDAP